jgi:aspartate aminotransferase
MSKLAERITHLSESQTIAMAKLSREMQEQGHDIISLSLGEPDFITPIGIRESAKKAIDDGFTFYTPISGNADLRTAISEKFRNENNLDYKPENIVVSTGAKQSIANVILSLLNPGEEVIVPAPYWVSYTQMISLAQGVPVFVYSSVETDYKVTAEQIRKAITPRTKLLIFSSPCNPSGSVYTKNELEEIAKVISEYEDLYIVSDEIYEHINFSGKHESIAQFDFIKDRVIIINGVSKCYAMTGWRIGYIGAPKWIAEACDKMQGQFTSGTSSISQKAAAAALKTGDSFFIEMCGTYKKRRDIAIKMIREIPGMKVNMPMGAFYVFPDISSFFGKTDGEDTIRNSSDLCMYLLHKAKVAVVSGEAFGDSRCIRLSYALSDEKLVIALTRIKECLARLK